MATVAPGAPPAWFRIVALIAVAWNAFGVFMYLHSVGVFGDPMADLTPGQRAAAESIPAFITGAFAVGTFAGLGGSLGLLLGRRWAWPLLLVSLVALLMLEGWIVFVSGYRNDFGLGIPIAVSLGALLLAWLATLARKRGWLT
ncbi:MAG TPA: hypothetical protein VHM92_04590 [Allosphingosinicella sp.]|nr:hypothetical protein [Allosphingosinicella sp.]